MAANVTPVTLKIDGLKDREVQFVSYSFARPVDVEGQLAGIPRGGFITIRVKALNDGNNELLAWKLAPTTPKNISVDFLNTIDGSAMKSIKGTNCYCVDFKEQWSEGKKHYEEIKIVCKALENGPAKYENPWE